MTSSNPPGSRLLIAAATLFSAVFLLLPLIAVFVEAFRNGIEAYFAALAEPDAFSAMTLTMIAAGCSVFFNVVFGLCAAWLIARFNFAGRRTLLTMIDIPLAVSPVIAGMIYVLLYGASGPLGSWFESWGIKIIFATPGIILVTTFVTLPLVVRELIPILVERGCDEEEAALTMGASGWQMFFLVTLPSIKWALLYGVILSNARAMGEFGAVSVVSGHIRGLTNTLPLHIEILYNEYRFAAAFSVASLLALLAILTIAVNSALEDKTDRSRINSKNNLTTNSPRRVAS